MTTEEKVRAYDELLDKAKQIYNKENDVLIRHTIEDLFPEIKESEDERIRKELLEHCKNQAEPYIQTGNEYPQIQSWITWLEKQGNQKSVDETKAKFKVGDWVIFNRHHNSVYQVEKIQDSRYYLRHYLGGTLSVHFDNELIRLWTIQDAKDGDVLTFKNDICGIIICKSPTDYDTRSYCRLVNDNFINKEESGWDSTLLVPATKEQRDLLFSKIKEAGYEWDVINLKLNRISQRMVSAEAKEAMYDKPKWNVSDFRTWQYIVSDVLTKKDGIGQYLDSGECKKIAKYMQEEWSKKFNIEQKPAWSEDDMKFALRTEYEKGRADAIAEMQKEWSEEDEAKLKSILFHIEDVENKDVIAWLKSLRPQNNITDEELAQAKKSAYNDALDKIEYHSGEPTFDDGWSAAIWYLKKRNAQPQNRWKPSDGPTFL